jgi:predicted DNA-binding protein (MmcQ/YjbR family)
MRPKQLHGSQSPTGQTGTEHSHERGGFRAASFVLWCDAPVTADELRHRCLAMPGAVEEYPFGPTASVFKVGGKIFAIASLAADPLTVSLKCEPEISELLRAGHDAIAPGYHLNKRHWITVTIGRDAPDALVRDLIEDSYDLVRPRRKEPR